MNLTIFRSHSFGADPASPFSETPLPCGTQLHDKQGGLFSECCPCPQSESSLKILVTLNPKGAAYKIKRRGGGRNAATKVTLPVAGQVPFMAANGESHRERRGRLWAGSAS